jgi:hypothetical protein
VALRHLHRSRAQLAATGVGSLKAADGKQCRGQPVSSTVRSIDGACAVRIAHRGAATFASHALLHILGGAPRSCGAVSIRIRWEVR